MTGFFCFKLCWFKEIEAAAEEQWGYSSTPLINEERESRRVSSRERRGNEELGFDFDFDFDFGFVFSTFCFGVFLCVCVLLAKNLGSKEENEPTAYGEGAQTIRQ